MDEASQEPPSHGFQIRGGSRADLSPRCLKLFKYFLTAGGQISLIHSFIKDVLPATHGGHHAGPRERIRRRWTRREGEKQADEGR